MLKPQMIGVLLHQHNILTMWLALLLALLHLASLLPCFSNAFSHLDSELIHIEVERPLSKEGNIRPARIFWVGEMMGIYLMINNIVNLSYFIFYIVIISILEREKMTRLISSFKKKGELNELYLHYGI